MNKLLFSLLCVLISLSSFSSKVFAWGELGHAVVGYVAEENLTAEAKQMVFEILGFEPLSVAAIFPDLVRSDKRFSGYKDGFNFYHFITIPYGKKIKDVKDRNKKDAGTIIEKVPGQLFNSKLSVHQKAVFLRYLIHIVGDVHQPLHVGNGLDRGGNLCFVKWRNPNNGLVEKSNLHKIWDEKIIENIAFEFQKENKSDKSGKRWFGYKELANIILKDNKASVKQTYKRANKLVEPSKWYKESQEIHRLVYPKIKNRVNNLSSVDKIYCKSMKKRKVVNGIYDEKKIPLLDDEYIQRTIPLVKKQILTAGYRLAGLLNRLAKTHKVKPRDSKLDMKLLGELKPVN